MATSTSKIFLVNRGGDSLTTLTEHAYEKEEHLQEFLAQYPDLIPGDQIGESPRRWLLISREMTVPDDEGAGRWSLDHLFVDQDSIPTFVECKRSSDTRGRREVVAQMLDYAANGVAHWTPEAIRAAAEKTIKTKGANLDQELEKFLDLDGSTPQAEAIEEFWSRLADNLKSKRIRLIFVADRISSELKKLVEFMNAEMINVEVLAVEIKQYLEPNDQHKVLVPTVIGETAQSRIAKQVGGKDKITRDTFLSKCPDPAAEFFRELFSRAESLNAFVAWGTVGCSIRLRDSDGKPHSLVYCYPPDSFSFNLDNNAMADENLRSSIRQQLLASGLVKESGQYTIRGKIERATMYRLLDVSEEAIKTVQAFQSTYNKKC